MKRENYLKIYNRVVEKISKENMISYEEIEEGLEYLREKEPIKKDIYSNAEEISELYALRWGILGMIFGQDDIEENKYNVVYCSLITNIANSCLSIIELAKLGYSFQVNILMRNLCETCFLLLTLLIDKEKCKKYLNSPKEGDEYEIWSKEFRFKKLNECLEKYENTFLNTNNDKFLPKWRRELYSFYSGFMHNDFFKCYIKSYSNNNEFYHYNVWGLYNNDVKLNLESLNYLMWVVDKFFMNIISNKKIIDIEILINKNMRSQWNDTSALFFIINELYDEDLK